MNTRTITETMKPGMSLPRIYALEAKYECLKILRLPAYVIPTIAFPVLFYLLFGVAFKGGPGKAFDMATYLVATYGAFGVMNAALFAFGVGVAVERGQGWLLFKRATPMPPLAHLLAKLAMSVMFSLLMVTCLFTLAATAGGVRLPLGTWTALAAVQVAGALPFAAFGLAVGSWAGPNSAPAILNLIGLPAAFGSGMWIPIQALPGFMRQLAQFLPPYHYAQLALGTLGLDRNEPVGRHIAVLVVFTIVSLAFARLGWRRDEGKTFG